MLIYNIENRPGDGGKMARVAGGYATIKSHIENKVSVLLPSKKSIDLDPTCRAQIGAVAGGGLTSQPIMKAGKAHYMWHATNQKWPVNRGVKCNPVDHPFGGKQHHKGASSMVSTHWHPRPTLKTAPSTISAICGFDMQQYCKGITVKRIRDLKECLAKHEKDLLPRCQDHYKEARP